MDYRYLKNQIAIVGVGYTNQGKVPGRTAASFHAEAAANAVRDAGIAKDDVDGLFLYRYFEPIGGDYELTGFTVAEALGIRPKVISHEHYCTRAWLANIVGLLQSGQCRYVVLSYGDNARSAKRNFVKELHNGKATDELAAFGDLSTMAKYAMLAQRAKAVYGTGSHVWKEIAIAQREWACLNPIAAMYGKPMTDSSYESSDFVVEPFRLLDATPVSDGGRAIVLTTAENARKLDREPVYISGFGSANMPLSPYRHTVGEQNNAAAIASRMAFEMAEVSHDEIDACEVYDCFTYTVESTLCSYGFFRPEKSAEWLTRSHIGPGGSMPVNTSGGMLSEAYFMGLTPISEAVMQLTRRCGQRQLGYVPGTKAPKRIICSDNGGVFQSHCTLILERG